ncbi:hypothetical protein P5637_07505 [Bacillus paralicheniformis]|uniref:Uncharacterized protein n=1 Tax=Bacillus paralicheniformis TaxID=1648923 RepID=A0ABY3FS33_9BACI|nr:MULTISPECIES: hypothetical protein [Bacillus]EWH19913.1 hypothetical protein M769_0124160 [Bacillus haynesii]KND06241.1 hypothetical protein ACJ43_17885 [Bacillus paralicheniformis]TWL34489.1 hypothetical protein CHCC15381_2542 [Bacillus paralicheniformis]TWN93147.1 hypothetical protein CHCC20491_1798 [Bacillus paralicheniformis]
MEEVQSFIPILVSTVVGGAISFFSTLVVQSFQIKKQAKMENMKAKREYKLKRMNVYNEILNIQNKEYVVFIDTEEGTCHFKDRIFFDSIKPILYQNYHLLGDKVAEAIKNIEDFLYLRHIALDHPGITDDRQVCTEFLNIIDLMENEIKQFRLDLEKVEKV